MGFCTFASTSSSSSSRSSPSPIHHHHHRSDPSQVEHLSPFVILLLRAHSRAISYQGRRRQRRQAEDSRAPQSNAEVEEKEKGGGGRREERQRERERERDLRSDSSLCNSLAHRIPLSPLDKARFPGQKPPSLDPPRREIEPFHATSVRPSGNERR